MLKLTFSPEQNTPEFVKSTEEYKKIWDKDGERIVENLERAAEMPFDSNIKNIKVVVYNGYSFVKWRENNNKKEVEFIKMRASYPAEIKTGTLIHELGHILLLNLKGFRHEGVFVGMERTLFLILFDVWEELFGKKFAENQVIVESKRTGIFDYKEAWRWALSMNREKRQDLLKISKEISAVENKGNAKEILK
ncbi:MAG: hypothetical protein GXP44_02555 [bacterium]|nr:hypothetical protein [bacterium]